MREVVRRRDKSKHRHSKGPGSRDLAAGVGVPAQEEDGAKVALEAAAAAAAEAAEAAAASEAVDVPEDHGKLDADSQEASEVSCVLWFVVASDPRSPRCQTSQIWARRLRFCSGASWRSRGHTGAARPCHQDADRSGPRPLCAKRTVPGAQLTPTAIDCAVGAAARRPSRTRGADESTWVAPASRISIQQQLQLLQLGELQSTCGDRPVSDRQ